MPSAKKENSRAEIEALANKAEQLLPKIPNVSMDRIHKAAFHIVVEEVNRVDGEYAPLYASVLAALTQRQLARKASQSKSVSASVRREWSHSGHVSASMDRIQEQAMLRFSSDLARTA